jgi:predicted RNase H-like HicB family nuclease
MNVFGAMLDDVLENVLEDMLEDENNELDFEELDET